MPEYVDKPEPRGQTIAAVLAVGAIYLALPRNVVVGPIWLLPTVIVVLLVPTVVSHRVGKQSRRCWILRTDYCTGTANRKRIAPR